MSTVHLLATRLFKKSSQEVSVVFKQHCRTTPRLNFFMNRIVNQWNSLPQYVTASASLNMFKNNLDQFWNEIGYGQIKRPLTY